MRAHSSNGDDLLIAEELARPSRSGGNRVRSILRRRALLQQAAIFGLVLGTVIAFLVPTLYESTTRLMPPDKQSGLAGMALLSAFTGGVRSGGGGAAGLGGLASDLLGGSNTGDLFVGVLGSETVQQDLVDRYHLRWVYLTFSRKKAREALADNTEISQDKRSGIISISVIDRNPHRAAAIARDYVNELDRRMTELNTSAAHRERIFLEQRLSGAKADLDRAVRELSAYSSEHGTIDVTEQGKAMMEGVARVQSQLIMARSELSAAEQVYAPGHPRVRTAQARVNELEKQLQKLGGTPGKATPDDGEQSVVPALRALPLVGARYADLYLEAKIQEMVYQGLTEQYELARVQEARETPVVKVLDDAKVPEEKASPARILIIISITLLAFVITGGFILAGDAYGEMEPDDERRRLITTILDFARNSRRKLRAKFVF